MKTVHYADMLMGSLLFFVLLIISIAFVLPLIKTPKTNTPEPVLAPAEASKILFEDARYRVFEFTDPVTYKRYIVFDTYRGVSALEAPRPVLPLEEK